MSEYVKLATGAGDQFLAALAESQDAFLKYISTFSSLTPTPTPPVQMPTFMAELPTPKEVADANFAFASKLLKQQKDFTEKLLAATAPVK